MLKLGTLIVGGGPAGLAVLLAARQCGLLDVLLLSGLRIIERTKIFGAGEIGNYLIRSDSLADSFLKQIDTEIYPPLRQTLKMTAGIRMDAQRGQPVELTTVGEFLVEIANELRHQLIAKDFDPFISEIEAIRSFQQSDGSWITECRHSNGSMEAFHSLALVIATGAFQPVNRLFEQKVAGNPLLPRYAEKTIQSGEFLGIQGRKKANEILGGKVNPKVAIVGASHSAISSADLCLHQFEHIPFEPESITVLHREALRLTYASPEEAWADGYSTFGSDDICPKTGRVFPLAGFRSDSRELLRHHWQLGSLKSDNRLRLLPLEQNRFEEANAILDEADMIIAAFGYRPRALPLFDHASNSLSLFCERGVNPLVNDQSLILDADACPIPGLFGIGLSDGYPLSGVHGEPSFTGQANGLALWQSDIGENLVKQLLKLIHGANA